MGVGLLRHQHFEEGADLGQQGPAQWAVLFWSFTWGNRERRLGLASCAAISLARLGQIFTKGGEGGGGVQDVPWMEVLLGGRRPVGDEDVVMVIGSERERQSGHPGRILNVREEIICKKRRSLMGPSVQGAGISF